MDDYVVEHNFPVIGPKVMILNARKIYGEEEVILLTIEDVTERRQAEQQWLQHERMLAQVQQVAHIGSWEWDMAGDQVSWSAELYRIYGVAPEQHAATFEAYLALVHPLDRERVRQTIEQAGRDRQPFEFEERIVRPDGSVRILLSRGSVDIDPAGRAIRMLGACQDITERKRAEQLEAGQHEILAGIAAQRPLAQSLEQIAGAYLHGRKLFRRYVGHVLTPNTCRTSRKPGQ